MASEVFDPRRRKHTTGYPPVALPPPFLSSIPWVRSFSGLDPLYSASHLQPFLSLSSPPNGSGGGSSHRSSPHVGLCSPTHKSLRRGHSSSHCTNFAPNLSLSCWRKKAGVCVWRGRSNPRPNRFTVVGSRPVTQKALAGETCQEACLELVSCGPSLCAWCACSWIEWSLPYPSTFYWVTRIRTDRPLW